MIDVMINIFLVCVMILLVFTLAGAVAVFFFIIVDYIGDVLRGWRK